MNCCKMCATNSIRFLGPENGSLAVKMKARGYLWTEILTKTIFHHKSKRSKPDNVVIYDDLSQLLSML